MNMPQIFEVSSSPIPYASPAGRFLTMGVWFWDWNGKKMVQVHFRLGFYKFRGTKPLKDLECYPLEFDPNKEATLASIKARSTKFISSILVGSGSSQMFTYDGEAYCDRLKGAVSAVDEEVNHTWNSQINGQ